MADHALADALHALAAHDIPEAADPWPALRDRLAARSSPASRPRGALRRAALAAAVAALAALALLGTALAFGRPLPGFNLHYGLVLVDRASPRPTPAPGAPSAALRVSPPPPLTGDQARRRADFPLRLPTWLPAGIAPLTCYDPRQPPPRPNLPQEDVVSCSSHGPNGAFLTLQEVKPRPGAPIGGLVVSTANAEAITVRGQPGLYARGSWNDDGTWNARLDYAYLSWSEDGITYTLITHGLGLGRADLLRVAESLR